MICQQNSKLLVYHYVPHFQVVSYFSWWECVLKGWLSEAPACVCLLFGLRWQGLVLTAVPTMEACLSTGWNIHEVIHTCFQVTDAGSLKLGSACVCVRVHACLSACMHVCVCARVCVHVCEAVEHFGRLPFSDILRWHHQLSSPVLIIGP